MAKKISKKTTKKHQTRQISSNKETFKEGLLAPPKKHNRKESFKDQILEVNKIEQDYDKIFDQKLTEEYKQFKNMKEHNMQMKKFLRILVVIIVIIVVALLLMNLRV